MRQFAVASLIVAVTAVFPSAASAQNEQNQQDAQLQKLIERVEALTDQIAALQAENDQLRQALMNQHAGAAADATVYPSQPLFSDTNEMHFYPRPGASPPSWIDTLIQRNRERALEAWAKRRANERLVDQRLAEITAESRQIGASYAPRPLREAVLAGGDPVAERNELIEARDEDFKELFDSPSVQEYLNTKQEQLQTQIRGKARRADTGGSIASARVYRMANQLRKDFQDTTILFGAGGVTGSAPGGLNLGAELTRQRRDSPNITVSGPTRDTLEAARRMAAVEAAVVADADVEMILRHQAVMAAHRQMQMTRASAHTMHDLANVQGVLNGKVMRTTVPRVHAAPQPQPEN